MKKALIVFAIAAVGYVLYWVNWAASAFQRMS